MLPSQLLFIELCVTKVLGEHSLANSHVFTSICGFESQRCHFWEQMPIWEWKKWWAITLLIKLWFFFQTFAPARHLPSKSSFSTQNDTFTRTKPGDSMLSLLRWGCFHTFLLRKKKMMFETQKLKAVSCNVPPPQQGVEGSQLPLKSVGIESSRHLTGSGLWFCVD